MSSHGNANPGPATEMRGAGATVDVMTAMTRKRWLFFRWDAPEWRTLDRGAALRMFEERFLAYPFRMVVVGADFSSFDRRRAQSFVFMPLASFAARRSTEAEPAFLRRCIARVAPERGGPGEAGEVVYIDGRFVAEPERGVGVAWTAAFATVETQGEGALAAGLPGPDPARLAQRHRRRGERPLRAVRRRGRVPPSLGLNGRRWEGLPPRSATSLWHTRNLP